MNYDFEERLQNFSFYVLWPLKTKRERFLTLIQLNNVPDRWVDSFFKTQ
jgi:hypothetical protein